MKLSQPPHSYWQLVLYFLPSVACCSLSWLSHVNLLAIITVGVFALIVLPSGASVELLQACLLVQYSCC
jgi:hypothetical protein